MSYNILHDDNSNPQLWNNISANSIRSNIAAVNQLSSIEVSANLYKFSPFTLNNILNVYSRYSITGLTLPDDNNNLQSDIHYQRIGNFISLTIQPGANALITLTQKKYIQPRAQPFFSIPLSELDDAGQELFNSLSDNIVIQGTGYYVDNAGPTVEKLFTYSIIKQVSPASTYIVVNKADFDELTEEPGWELTDRILFISISFTF
jgi:hypothetical protein